MNRVKVGVIGTGSISDAHINAYLRNPNVELYAFQNATLPHLEAKAKKYGITRYTTDLKEFLAMPELEAVSVCVSNIAHAPVTIAALEAGKHVLCEKPMAMNAAEAESMAAAAEKSGKLLMTGFVRRFWPDCAVLRDFIEAGDLGEIYYVRAVDLRRHGNPGGWFQDRAKAGGGPMMDMGIHLLDYTRYLLGNPRPVSVYGASFNKLGDRPSVKVKPAYRAASASAQDICTVEDMASALVRYENDAVVHIETSYSLNIKENEDKIELFGTKGGAKITRDIEIFTEKNGRLINVSFFDKMKSDFVSGIYISEIDHFVDCVQNGTKCIVQVDDGVQIMRIVDAIYRSAETKHEVFV
jgi:predicted dehydrogenase